MDIVLGPKGFCNNSLCSGGFLYVLFVFPKVLYSILTNLSSAELSVILRQKVLQNKGNGCRKFALNLKLLYGAGPL